MKKFRGIYLWEAPSVWFNDKFRALTNKPEVYISSIIPGLFTIIGISGSFFGLLNLSNYSIFRLLLWFLFVYGLINFFLIFTLQRNSIKLKRIQNVFEVIHKELIHKQRDYITRKNELISIGENFSSIQIENKIKDILNAFNKSFIKDFHGPRVVITLKYLLNSNLYPIRVPNDDNRNTEPENIISSYIYKALKKSKQRIGFVYVKNLKKPDKNELLVLGNDMPEIQKRALNHYSTFISLPIRSGEMSIDKSKLKFSKDLGILGLDMNKRYAFGNLYPFEIQTLSILTDILAELVLDLILIKEKEIKNG